jgi:transcriptional regulator with XRE-family HTH domain
MDISGGSRMAKSVVGERIREQRKRRGLTQEAVAGLAELDRKHMGAIEMGKSEAGFYTLIRIAGALHIPIEELVTGLVFVPSEHPAGRLELRTT